jgi:site-specific recombinase XerD
MRPINPHVHALVKPPGMMPSREDTGGLEARELTIATLAPPFLEWRRYEMRRAPSTIVRYREALSWVVHLIGDQPAGQLHVGHLMTIRRWLEEWGCREARVAAILHALRSFLTFCQEVLQLPVLDPREVRVPRIPRRDVVYLTKEEVQRYLEAIIAPGEPWEAVSLTRLRFRTLVEVLLGTGARISEVLSLNRSDIHWVRKEAKIIGKGNKQLLGHERLDTTCRYDLGLDTRAAKAAHQQCLRYD